MTSNKANIVAWSTVNEEEIKAFGDEGDLSRQGLLNPIIEKLSGDITGKKVLDAGCGTGYLARIFAKKGAVVTGVEPAESFFSHCIKTESNNPLGITYLQEDLSDFNQPNQFYLVISNMVFMDIPDYQAALRICIKALKSGGQFIFSISHPCFPGSDKDWDELGFVKVRDYFDRPAQNNKYGQSWDRPIQEYISLLRENNCELTDFIEPQPTEEMLRANPAWERNYNIPQFLVIKAIKK